jgi:transcriptional regulator with XRE-family HTH domain
MTIRALRKMRGMTQAELAKLVGLERTSITNIERGNQILTEQTINALAEAMGYRVEVKFRRKT